jgi:glutaredoxin 1
MKATVYTGPSCIWCDRVKSLLKDNDYIIEEIQMNGVALKDLQTKFNKTIRTVPQVIIDDKFIGGYHEVESLMKGTTSINKV